MYISPSPRCLSLDQKSPLPFVDQTPKNPSSHWKKTISKLALVWGGEHQRVRRTVVHFKATPKAQEAVDKQLPVLG